MRWCSMARTADHGYGAEHQRLRAAWQKRIDDGEDVRCWRNGEPILPGMDWDLGHDDNDRTKYNGPECVKCNRATKGHRTSIVVDDSRVW